MPHGVTKFFTKGTVTKYEGLQCIHREVQVTLLNVVVEFGDWAQLEAEWEAAHPDRGIEVTKEIGATSTVETFETWMEAWFPVRFPDFLLEGDPSKKAQASS